MADALLFDLDETLIVEEPAAVAAFRAAALSAASRIDVDPDKLALAARACARDLWRRAPTYAYCRRVGISSWEGLWCRYEGDRAELRALREWSSTYRRQAWTLALAQQDVSDAELAEELGERFRLERRARHEVFPDAAAALRTLRDSHVLALVTNGASCLQREKLHASGLGGYFDAVVVSADVETAKPDPAVFRRALAELAVGHAVMIGDSIDKDVRGALAAGLGAVWVNRAQRARPEDLTVPEVTSLGQLPPVLAALR